MPVLVSTAFDEPSMLSTRQNAEIIRAEGVAEEQKQYNTTTTVH